MGTLIVVATHDSARRIRARSRPVIALLPQPTIDGNGVGARPLRIVVLDRRMALGPPLSVTDASSRGS